jgi:ribosomal protein S18
MEVDFMHSVIEYAQKHVLVIMHDWMNIFKMARSNRNKNKNADKYACQELKFIDFKNLKKLSAYVIQNRTLDSMNCKVQWLKTKRMRYESEKPNIFSVTISTVSIVSSMCIVGEDLSNLH